MLRNLGMVVCNRVSVLVILTIAFFVGAYFIPNFGFLLGAFGAISGCWALEESRRREGSNGDMGPKS